MRGCARSAALILTVLFVFSLVPTYFLFNLGRVVTDRETVKEALDGEALLNATTEAAVRQAVDDLPVVRDLPPLVRDSAALDEILNRFFPPGWATAQTDAVVDNIFDYLETGDEAFLNVTIDTDPLLEALRGEPGRQVVRDTLEDLPTCTGQLPSIDLASGQIDIPGCLPPFVPIDLLGDQLHNAVVLALNSDLAGSFLDEGVMIDLLGEDQASARQSWQELRDLYRIGRQGVWLLWLVPLILLIAILVLAVRSPAAFGHWSGWPLLAAAVLALLLSLATPLLVDAAVALLGLLAPVPQITLLIDQVLRLVVESLASPWLDAVRLQAGISLVAGIVLVAAAFVVTWMLGGQAEVEGVMTAEY